MDTLKRKWGKKMEKFLKDLPKEHYASAYFEGKRYGETTNSIAESFNSWILDFRSLPIFQMMEGIRKKLKVLNERKLKAKKRNTILCPKVEKIIRDDLKAVRHWHVI